jgi:hypothetical protein
MPTGEDRGQNLLDYVRLADDDSAKLLEHQSAGLAELA